MKRTGVGSKKINIVPLGMFIGLGIGAIVSLFMKACFFMSIGMVIGLVVGIIVNYFVKKKTKNDTDVV